MWVRIETGRQSLRASIVYLCALALVFLTARPAPSNVCACAAASRGNSHEGCRMPRGLIALNGPACEDSCLTHFPEGSLPPAPIAAVSDLPSPTAVPVVPAHAFSWAVVWSTRPMAPRPAADVRAGPLLALRI